MFQAVCDESIDMGVFRIAVVESRNWMGSKELMTARICEFIKKIRSGSAKSESFIGAAEIANTSGCLTRQTKEILKSRRAKEILILRQEYSETLVETIIRNVAGVYARSFLFSPISQCRPIRVPDSPGRLTKLFKLSRRHEMCTALSKTIKSST